MHQFNSSHIRVKETWEAASVVVFTVSLVGCVLTALGIDYRGGGSGCLGSLTQHSTAHKANATQRNRTHPPTSNKTPTSLTSFIFPAFPFPWQHKLVSTDCQKRHPIACL